MKPTGRTLPAGWIWVAASILLGAATLHVLAGGYVNDQALFRWTLVDAILDAGELGLENISLLYPHLPLYLLVPFHYIPGLASPFAPHLVSCLIAGLLLALWYRHLRMRNFSRGMAAVLVLLMGAHPVFLWAATSGAGKALGLLIFYLVCLACSRLLRIGDLRSIIALGGLLALYFFVDERTAFLLLALMPLLPFMAPLRMLRASILSTFLLTSLPAIIAILAWIYLNWLFHGDPLYFLTSPESAFIGASQSIAESEWLRTYGGRLFPALGAATALLALILPAFAWALWRLRTRRRLLIGMAVLGLHPLLAVAIATQHYFVEHPLDFVYLALAACMSALLLSPRAWNRAVLPPIAWLLVSCIGGWAALHVMPTDEMRDWRTTFVGAERPPAPSAERQVGQWLAHNREATLIDHRAAYRILAARGDADGLWLPFMNEFKFAEHSSPAHAPQVVVLDPRHPQAWRDRLTTRFADLHDHGHPGYRLALDAPPWRVYRRQDLPPPRTERPQ